MKYRDDVLLWLEKMNPQLLIAEEKSAPLLLSKRITLHDDAQVLIVKGVDGAFYGEALDKGLKVLLVEENVGKIVSFLENVSFVPHENLFVTTADVSQLFPILKKFVFQKIQEVGDLSDITPYIGGMEMSFSEYRDLGQHILPNILSNLLHINTYIDGRDLIGCLDGEEVIVCGSGISLENAIEEIKQMQSRPYIFATGTALPKLLDAGVIPDFFVAIDPFPIEDRFPSLKNVSIPFFYQNRTSRDLLFAHNGPKIFMGSSRGWQIEETLMQEIGIDNFFFDAGYNAGNFGAHIALSLGAGKVILVGMDGITRDGEDSVIAPSGENTRSDLLYGMDFFKTLQENFTDSKVVHYTKGLSFEGAQISKKIEVKGRSGIITLPESESYQGDLSKKVIDRYFDHSMLSSVRDFLDKMNHDGAEHQALAACLLAEFSLEPFYLNFMQPLWEVWKYLMPNSEDVISKITFFYNLLKIFSAKTGYDQGEFFLFGKKEGEALHYDDRGTLREKRYFYRGAEEGAKEKYKSNGALSVFQEMEKGLGHGEYKVYEAGHIIRSGSFVRGKPHGRHLCFYSGNIIDDVRYVHGKKCGVHKKFSLDGYKRSEISYHKDGDLFDTIHYDAQGQKEYTAIWKDGNFFESRYADKKKITSRVGKMEGSEMIFKEDK
jgi:uncharacterized Rossmann fold enzyme